MLLEEQSLESSFLLEMELKVLSTSDPSYFELVPQDK